MKREKDLEDKLESSLYFEKVLSKIALYLIENDNFENRINFILETVCKSIDASRGYIFEKTLDGKNFNNTFHWHKDDMCSRLDILQSIDLKAIKCGEKLLNKEGIISAEDINDLPEWIRKTLELQGVLSIIIYPIYRDGEIIGLVGFDYCEFYYKWTKNKYEFLKNVLGIVTRTYDKEYRERLTIEKTKSLKTLLRLLIMEDGNGMLIQEA